MATVEVTPKVTTFSKTETTEVFKAKETKAQEEVVVAPPTEPSATEEPKTDDVAAPVEHTAADVEVPEEPTADVTKEVAVEEPVAEVADIAKGSEEVAADVAPAEENVADDVVVVEEASGEEEKTAGEASIESPVGETE